jgi:hypothetical protein
MGKIGLGAAVVIALGITVGGLVIGAQAQGTPPGPPPGMEGGPGGPAGWGHGMMHRWMPGWMQGHGDGHGGMPHHPGHPMMGLIFPAEDRALTPPEVQKIAEAFLLWNGNRSWKVANVAENQDNTVSFNFAAPDGTVIAKFAVDKKTGHFHRLG